MKLEEFLIGTTLDEQAKIIAKEHVQGQGWYKTIYEKMYQDYSENTRETTNKDRVRLMQICIALGIDIPRDIWNGYIQAQTQERSRAILAEELKHGIEHDD